MGQDFRVLGVHVRFDWGVLEPTDRMVSVRRVGRDFFEVFLWIGPGVANSLDLHVCPKYMLYCLWRRHFRLLEKISAHNIDCTHFVRKLLISPFFKSCVHI